MGSVYDSDSISLLEFNNEPRAEAVRRLKEEWAKHKKQEVKWFFKDKTSQKCIKNTIEMIGFPSMRTFSFNEDGDNFYQSKMMFFVFTPSVILILVLILILVVPLFIKEVSANNFSQKNMNLSKYGIKFKTFYDDVNVGSDQSWKSYYFDLVHKFNDFGQTQNNFFASRSTFIPLHFLEDFTLFFIDKDLKPFKTPISIYFIVGFEEQDEFKDSIAYNTTTGEVMVIDSIRLNLTERIDVPDEAIFVIQFPSNEVPDEISVVI